MKKYRIKKGARIEDGFAHTLDHQNWSRRSFLNTLGAAGPGLAIPKGGVYGSNSSQLLRALEGTDRILVLIQLDGGNDGLNTVVPYRNDIYHNIRPTLSLRANDILDIDGAHGFHPAMNALKPVYDRGDMAIIQNVGYEDQSFSHFRSTDIWLSSTGPETYSPDGWLGNYLRYTTPDYETNPPTKPLGVQVGVSNQMFLSEGANAGMTLPSAEVFALLAEQGIAFPMDGIPSTQYGSEMRFLRTVANDSFRYGSEIKNAAERGRNRVSYEDTALSEGLSIVARVIEGDLETKLYHLSIDGFDTHSEQKDRHTELWLELSNAIRSFLEDLKQQGLDDRVLVMTFSEFGRTIYENGSLGTDHGSGAPLFLFGTNIKGGLYGNQPNLNVANPSIDPDHEFDYRSIYSELLSSWFGVPSSDLGGITGIANSNLGFVSNPTGVAISDERPIGLDQLSIYPNPAKDHIFLKTGLQGNVHFEIVNMAGQVVQTRDFSNSSGKAISDHISINHLPAGTYLVSAQSKDKLVKSKFVRL